MIKEEVIKKIDELRSLFAQAQDILCDYEDVIAEYADNEIKFSYDDCQYWSDVLNDAKENIMNYWDGEEYEGDDTELDESVEGNSSSAQEIRDTIYSMLMTHSDYFRKDFGGQFDSDDDIECEINDIVKRVKKGQNIQYVKQPSPDFAEKLQSLVQEYIRAGGRDDVICQDG